MNLNYTDKDNYKCLKDYLLDFKYNVIFKKNIDSQSIILCPINDYDILINSLNSSLECKDGIYNFLDANNHARHFYCLVSSNYIKKTFLNDQQVTTVQDILNFEKSIFYKNLGNIETKMVTLKLNEDIINDCIYNYENNTFQHTGTKIALDMVWNQINNQEHIPDKDTYIKEY